MSSISNCGFFITNHHIPDVYKRQPLDSAVGAAAAGGNIPLAQPAFEVKAKYLSVHGHINDPVSYTHLDVYKRQYLRKNKRHREAT